MSYAVKDKLRILIEQLKVWNTKLFGYIDLSIHKTSIELNEPGDVVSNERVQIRNIEPSSLGRFGRI